MDERFVTSLEISKRLKELGVPQRSEFYWYDPEGLNLWFIFPKIELQSLCADHSKIPQDAISAYLSDELLEWLPKTIITNRQYHLVIYKYGKEYSIVYENTYPDGNPALFGEDTRNKFLPNALAEMFIYLLEHKIIKPEDLRKETE